MTLPQSIQGMIDNINVTDRQEEGISTSYNNLKDHLNSSNNLNVTKVFLNGSYPRYTIIRPLDDIDLFAVLDYEEYKDDNGQMPNPQSVLTKIKNYLTGISEYEGKVSQDRPCVTVTLSDKNFDVLPCFDAGALGYYMPNHDLESWIITDPKGHSSRLTDVNQNRSQKVVPTVKAIKYWNRELDKLIPSFHIEEIAISIFTIQAITNFEDSIRNWFNNAESYLNASHFKNDDDYNKVVDNINNTKDKINAAFTLYDDGDNDGAIEAWKEVFGKEFPTLSAEEAKTFSSKLSEGTLMVASTGILSETEGKKVPKSKGFYSEISE